MLGGIIGDLAASTYLRDPKTFYKLLIDDKALLSEYGLSIIATYQYFHTTPKAQQGPEGLKEKIRELFRSGSYQVQEVSDKALAWADGSAASWLLTPTVPGMMLNRLGAYYDFTRDGSNGGWKVILERHNEKEEGYAHSFMDEIMSCLRAGMTKDQTYKALGPVFNGCRRDWNWKERESPICLLLRAWDCFYNAFDFGSTIHNAVRYPNSCTRQIASLTGLIAEGMYGCAIYYIKDQFQTQDYILGHNIEFPEAIRKKYGPLLGQMRWESYNERTFFKKNDALTNVNRHTFTPCGSRFEGFELSPESREAVLRAFHTSWDDRFGFYLENGWVYCYRSHYLLGRFRIVWQGPRWIMTDIQVTEQLPKDLTLDKCLHCALASCRIPELRS